MSVDLYLPSLMSSSWTGFECPFCFIVSANTLRNPWTFEGYTASYVPVFGELRSTLMGEVDRCDGASVRRTVVASDSDDVGAYGMIFSFRLWRWPLEDFLED